MTQLTLYDAITQMITDVTWTEYSRELCDGENKVIQTNTYSALENSRKDMKKKVKHKYSAYVVYCNTSASF